MKNILSDINEMLSITDSYQAPERIMNLLFGEKKERIKVFKDFLDYFKCDVSYDCSMNTLKMNMPTERITSRILLLKVFQLWFLNY